MHLLHLITIAICQVKSQKLYLMNKVLKFKDRVIDGPFALLLYNTKISSSAAVMEHINIKRPTLSSRAEKGDHMIPVV